MKVTAQVDFTGISTEPKNDEVAVQAVLNGFQESTSELDESFSVNILKVEVEEAESDTGKVSTEITFESEDFDDEIESEKDEEEEDSAYTERIESEATELLRNKLEDICEKNEIEFDIADVSI